MGAAQAKLSEQPEILDLLRVLEQSKLAKERQEVESLLQHNRGPCLCGMRNKHKDGQLKIVISYLVGVDKYHF